MSVLKSEVERLTRLCPSMQTIASAPRLMDVPRRVLDHVLLWHGQLRMAGLSDVDFLDGDEGIVYATGFYQGSAGAAEYPELPKEQPILGAIVWQVQRDGSWWTMLGWVEPHARRQGLYSEMWASVVHLAKEAGVKRIQGGTHVSNTQMRALMEKLGRKPHSIIYDYRLDE